LKRKCFSFQLHDTKGYDKILSNLTPYTIYYIKIDVRPIFDNGSETGYWSETFKTSHKTKEDGKILIYTHF
jgi:hypothetical protein